MGFSHNSTVTYIDFTCDRCGKMLLEGVREYSDTYYICRKQHEDGLMNCVDCQSKVDREKIAESRASAYDDVPEQTECQCHGDDGPCRFCENQSEEE